MNKLYENQCIVKVAEILAEKAAKLEDDDLALKMLEYIYEIKQEALAVVEQEREASERVARMVGGPDLLT
jgi:ribonucleotide reductase alpha subunit